MDFARPCCLLFFTVSSSHTPNLSLSPPKRRQDSSAKIASLNMPITYTFVICRSDCWANAHVHTSLSHKRNSCTVCHACMNNESTPQQRWSYWHPHICRACCACASPTELCACVKRSFVPQEQSLKYSYASTTSRWIRGHRSHLIQCSGLSILA